MTDGLISTLCDEGLITIDEGKHVRLLPKGREMAEKIIRRHRLAERLICDALGAEVEESEVAACEYEHLWPKELPTRYARFWAIHAIVLTISRSPRGLLPTGARRTEAYRRFLRSTANRRIGKRGLFLYARARKTGETVRPRYFSGNTAEADSEMAGFRRTMRGNGNSSRTGRSAQHLCMADAKRIIPNS